MTQTLEIDGAFKRLRSNTATPTDVKMLIEHYKKDSGNALGATIERLEKSAVLESNIMLILKHHHKLSGERISEERRKKFIDRLRWWAEALKKDFRDATKEDLESAHDLLKAKTYEKEKGNFVPLTSATINTYVTIIRQFYKHIEGDDEEFPKKVRKLKPIVTYPELVSEDGETPIQIYTPAELDELIRLGRTSREKCLVALSYDCGGRMGEIHDMTMKNIKHNPPFYKVFLHGDKTFKRSGVGKRWVSCYFATPYIREYLKSHPYSIEKQGDRDKPFWINSGKYGGEPNEKLSQSGFKVLFDRLKAKAGIQGKRFHDLRHTKSTHLLRMRMQESKVKKFMGWSLNSKQLARYAHLVQEDIDEELCRMYGLPFERKKHDDIPIPIKCPKCSEVNEAGSDICSNCTSPLSAKAITNATTREKYWKQKFQKESESTAKTIKDMQAELKEMKKLFTKSLEKDMEKD